MCRSAEITSRKPTYRYLSGPTVEHNMLRLAGDDGPRRRVGPLHDATDRRASFRICECPPNGPQCR